MANKMNRLFLTFLALLAGFVTQVSPAQARLCGASDIEIGAVEPGRVGVRSAACQSAVTDAPAARQERGGRETSRVRPSRPRVYIPSVLFGADRAYE